MRQRQAGDRLRVVIAGNIYAKRALVRRFLEDDGFDVVGEALTGEELLAMGDLARADAVVVDGDLLHESIEPLRALAPDAAIVVFTGQPSGNGSTTPKGADGYLEKGVGLASLTALLHSLLSEAPSLTLGLGWAATVPAQRTERRVLAGLAGVAASIVLVAVVALAAVGGVGPSPTSAPVATPTAPGSESSPSPGPNTRELALGDLSDLREALAAGRPIEAARILDTLQRHLLAAQQVGFSISGIGATAARLLDPFLGDLAPDLLANLRSLFGSVFDVPTGTAGSGSGGGSTTGATSETSSGGTISSGTTSDGTTSGGINSGGGSGTVGGGGGGQTEGGGGGTGGGGGETEGGGGGVGGDGETEGGAPSPTSHGHGHHYGWTNKPPKGGWHGTKPHPQDGEHGTKPHHNGGEQGAEADVQGGEHGRGRDHDTGKRDR